MEEIFSSLVKDFVDETHPITQEVGALLLKLEEVWRAGGDGKPLLRGIRSGLHTIKGNGAMMGLAPIERLTHALEDVCPKPTDPPPAQQAALVQLLLEGCDLLGMLVKSAPGGELPAGPAEAFVARAALAQEGFRDAGASPGDGEAPREAGAAGAATPVAAEAEGGRGGARIADGDVDELL